MENDFQTMEPCKTDFGNLISNIILKNFLLYERGHIFLVNKPSNSKFKNLACQYIRIMANMLNVKNQHCSQKFMTRQHRHK